MSRVSVPEPIVAAGRLEQLRARLGGADLDDLVAQAVRAIGVGAAGSAQAVAVGYEDANVVATTAGGPVFLKFFAAARPLASCRRYVALTEQVMAAGVRHPAFLPDRATGSALLEFASAHGPRWGCALAFVAAPSLYERGGRLSGPEVDDLLAQVQTMSRLRVEPAMVGDEWSPLELVTQYRDWAGVLGDDSAVVAEIVDRFERVDVAALPRSFGHGDLVPTNLLCPGDGTVLIVDFGRADLLPRVHDLAMLTAQTLIDHDAGWLPRALARARLSCGLSAAELAALPVYAEAVNAAYIVGAHRTAAQGDDSPENQYWLERARRSAAVLRARR